MCYVSGVYICDFLWVCQYVLYLNTCYRCFCLGVPDETLIAPTTGLFPFSLPQSLLLSPHLVTLLVPKSQWAPGKLFSLYSCAKKECSVYQWDSRSLELTNQSASLVTPWTNQLVSLDPQGVNWCLFCANNDSNNDKASSTPLSLLTDRETCTSWKK